MRRLAAAAVLVLALAGCRITFPDGYDRCADAAHPTFTVDHCNPNTPSTTP